MKGTLSGGLGLMLDNVLHNVLTPQNLGQIGVKFLQAILLLVLSQTVLRLGNIIIDKLLKAEKDKKKRLSPGHINTLNQLLKSFLRYSVYFFLVTMLLSLLGIPVASLLAGAGIIGLAIGFGAQSLVKDIISGFFILLEDQFAVGDFIKTAGVEGIVTDVGLRTSKIRSFSGEVHILNNGAIQPVTNFSRNKARFRVIIPISYEENIERLVSILEEVCAELASANKNVLEGPKVVGISSFTEIGLELTLVGQALPLTQWGVERELRMLIKARFDAENIKMPYPKRIILNEDPSKERG